jgi:phage portal protein BeeE
MVYILSLHKKDNRKQLEKLLRNLPSRKMGSIEIWDLFFGKVKISEDPVKLQRRLRDEWE